MWFKKIDDKVYSLDVLYQLQPKRYDGDHHNGSIPDEDITLFFWKKIQNGAQLVAAILPRKKDACPNLCMSNSSPILA